ncbi:MAG: SpoIIE family protein phosphatase [Lachnospiraceae bacterium]|nr:SpoIIE family protein phosphatase [Lachnospiraceae bacterium]
MKMIQRFRSSMAINVIGAVMTLLILFGFVISLVGYISFYNAFREEYSTTTYHMADTAATIVNGNYLNDYLAGERTEEYIQTKIKLDSYCTKMNVSLVYVIIVDQSDYGRFVSVFNAVNNSVDNSSYTPWELGYKRNTTNDEYRAKYKAIYNKEAMYETVFRTHTTDGQHPHITTLVPVKANFSDVAAILCIQRPMSELYEARKPYLLNIIFWAILLAALASVFTIIYMRKQVVLPIRRTAEEATRFARENTKGEGLGTISRYRDISNLTDSIDKMETDMLNYMENLTAITAEKERMSTELSLASAIQENSVPNVFPAFPDRHEFDVYAVMDPAKEVGGDFYNFFLIDDDHLAFVIGDVSGKGIPGALFMMVTNILITDRTKMGGTPGEILTYVNQNICEHNQAEMFVTLWLGILEIPSGKVTFANAGHDDAAVYRKGGAFELYKTKHSLVAGAMEGIRYKDFEIQLGEGDKLFLYTDGVPEATALDNEMFTIPRMVDVLNQNKEHSPKEILESVHRSVDEFVGAAPQFDDLTMLCIELKKR